MYYEPLRKLHAWEETISLVNFRSYWWHHICAVAYSSFGARHTGAYKMKKKVDVLVGLKPKPEIQEWIQKVKIDRGDIFAPVKTPDRYSQLNGASTNLFSERNAWHYRNNQQMERWDIPSSSAVQFDMIRTHLHRSTQYRRLKAAGKS